MILLLKLVVAHLLGDFPLQRAGWATRKREPAVMARHLAIHAMLLAVVVGTTGSSPRLWLSAIGLVAAHGAIDWFLGGEGEKTPMRLAVDQALHGLSIAVCFTIMSPTEAWYWTLRLSEHLSQSTPWTLAAGLLLAVWVGRYLIGSWIDRVARQPGGQTELLDQGLKDAGARIGMLERGLIFLALVARMEALAGFVIGVKALLRLPEATHSERRALAEYFLLGTLASVAWAVLIALLTRTVLEAAP